MKSALKIKQISSLYLTAVRNRIKKYTYVIVWKADSYLIVNIKRLWSASENKLQLRNITPGLIDFDFLFYILEKVFQETANHLGSFIFTLINLFIVVNVFACIKQFPPSINKSYTSFDKTEMNYFIYFYISILLSPYLWYDMEFFCPVTFIY